MLHLKMEWKVIDRDHVALIFDKRTFAAFQSVADTKGIEPTDMINAALAELLGTVMMKPSPR